MNKFTSIVNILTAEEDFFLRTAPKDIGKLTNKIQKTSRPNTETGSYIKFLKRLSRIISKDSQRSDIQ